MEVQSSQLHANGYAPGKESVVDAHTFVQPHLATADAYEPGLLQHQSYQRVQQPSHQNAASVGAQSEDSAEMLHQQQQPSTAAIAVSKGLKQQQGFSQSQQIRPSMQSPADDNRTYAAQIPHAAGPLLNSVQGLQADAGRAALHADAWQGLQHAPDSDYEIDDGTCFSDEDEELGGSGSSSDDMHPGRSR